MSLAYVIRILVTTGDPDGVRVVEKSNWTGRGMIFARSDLAVPTLAQLTSPGIYVLLGEDPDGQFDQRVYIGEGEDVGKRLSSHVRDDAKDFWTKTVTFTSKDSTLNKAHIRHLESRLIGLAHSTHKAGLANLTKPMPPPMSDSDFAEAEGFLAEMLAIFPVIGVDVFDKPASVVATRSLFRISGPEASGCGEERSDGFLVLAGALARAKVAPALSQSTVRLRDRLISTGLLVVEGGQLRLTEDYLFKSPSTAAEVLLSRSANGRTEWVDEEGVTLKESQARAAGSAK